MAEGKDKQVVTDRYSNTKQQENVVDPRVVENFHRYSDVDRDTTAQHHSLGPGPNNASSGTHTHDGTTSRQLGAGISVTGSRGGNIALANLISQLVAVLGITDSTTP